VHQPPQARQGAGRKAQRPGRAGAVGALAHQATWCPPGSGRATSGLSQSRDCRSWASGPGAGAGRHLGVARLRKQGRRRTGHPGAAGRRRTRHRIRCHGSQSHASVVNRPLPLLHPMVRPRQVRSRQVRRPQTWGRRRERWAARKTRTPW
jgi:hypothetical protein